MCLNCKMISCFFCFFFFLPGTDVVIVKSGRRICGTGGCLANAPLHQNKSYFEFKIQSTGMPLVFSWWSPCFHISPAFFPFQITIFWCIPGAGYWFLHTVVWSNYTILWLHANWWNSVHLWEHLKPQAICFLPDKTLSKATILNLHTSHRLVLLCNI